MCRFLYISLLLCGLPLAAHASLQQQQGPSLPVVVNTWAGPFEEATAAAWDRLQAGGTAIDAVEEGCSACEARQCDRTVGFGGSPDEGGATSLDALIMDGDTMRAGAVCNLRRTKHAAAAARLVMERTSHTLLAGAEADAFAAEMGLEQVDSLATDESRGVWREWAAAHCQPNFRRVVSPDPSQSCGPYQPLAAQSSASSLGEAHALVQQLAGVQEQVHSLYPQQQQQWQPGAQPWPTATAHDTISMVVVAANGSVAAGSSSNGAIHKVPGRVGDAAVPGGGAYADSQVGGCGATGDGDVHLAFQPCLLVVEAMRQGLGPRSAAEEAVARIARRVPSFVGAVVAVSADGRHGAAAHGWRFVYSVASAASGGRVQTFEVEPLSLGGATSKAAAPAVQQAEDLSAGSASTAA